MRLRVTASSAAAEAAAEAAGEAPPLHDEYLDRAAFEERLGLANGGAGSAQASAGGGEGPPAALSRRQTLAAHYSALKPFVIISFSYLLFTTTDGAVRMVVLLHAYSKGFSAMQVAIMFRWGQIAPQPPAHVRGEAARPCARACRYHAPAHRESQPALRYPPPAPVPG